MKYLLRYVLCVLSMTLIFTACIDDSFTDSPSDQPRFSVDTLDMGVVFTEPMTVSQ